MICNKTNQCIINFDSEYKENDEKYNNENPNLNIDICETSDITYNNDNMTLSSISLSSNTSDNYYNDPYPYPYPNSPNSPNSSIDILDFDDLEEETMQFVNYKLNSLQNTNDNESNYNESNYNKNDTDFIKYVPLTMYNIKSIYNISNISSLELDYNLNYNLKYLYHIAGFYNIQKNKKMKKEDLIRQIVLFEINDKNHNVVLDRKMLFHYLDLLKENKYTKSFIMFP
jgi:hypothetical protein